MAEDATRIPSTYAQEFALPDGFAGVLKDLTREILRDQPKDVEAFCLQHFEMAVAAAAGANGRRGSVLDDPEPAAKLADLDPQEVEDLIHTLFREQDADGNRTLDRHEFKMVFNKLGSKLGLRKNDVRRILAEADRDDNGQISYAEFIPVAVSIIETIVAKQRLREQEVRRSQVKAQAANHVYHGMPADELAEMLAEIFREADADGNGTLDVDEFEKCLRDIRIGITRKEVNVLMFETYAGKDGMIDYEAFKPLCLQLLVEMTAQEWMEPSQDEKDLEEYVLAACAKEDEGSSGKLSTDALQRVLFRADLGITLLQICSIMSEAEEDASDMVDYAAFAPRCAFMVYACQHYRQKMAEKQERMQTLRSSDGWGMVYGKDRDTLEAELLEAFLGMDPERSGCLGREDIKMALKSVLDTDKKTLHALQTLAKQTEAATYKYQPVVDQAFRTIKGCLELAIVYEDD